jgi:hypothetical protein
MFITTSFDMMLTEYNAQATISGSLIPIISPFKRNWEARNATAYAKQRVCVLLCLLCGTRST